MSSYFHLAFSQKYNRKKDIHERFGGQQQGGISTPANHPFVFIFTGDADLWAIVLLSLKVSLSAVVIAGILGMPFGAFLAVTRFKGRGALIVFLNALMGLPPVVVGLAVYLMLSA